VNIQDFAALLTELYSLEHRDLRQSGALPRSDISQRLYDEEFCPDRAQWFLDASPQSQIRCFRVLERRRLEREIGREPPREAVPALLMATATGPVIQQYEVRA